MMVQYKWHYKPVAVVGNYNNVAVKRPTYPSKYCNLEDPGVFSRDESKGNSFSAGGGVKISAWLGINLSTTHRYSGSQSFSYKTTRKQVFCGKDAYITSASRVLVKP